MLFFMHMDMLTDQDIKRIGEEVGKVLEENVMPQFEYMHKQFDSIDRRFDSIDKRLGLVEGRMNSVMVTKSYLDDKLADLRGEFFSKLKHV